AVDLAKEVDRSWIWHCSHIGGHRFAGNVLWLPQGVVLGRVMARDASTVAATVHTGRIPLEHYRGRSGLQPVAQAAEAVLREQLGLTGIGDVELEGVDESVVRLRAGGASHVLRVHEESAPPIVTSCGGEPEPQRRLVAT